MSVKKDTTNKTKEKVQDSRLRRVVKYVIVIAVILGMTNPSVIPFLPSKLSSALTGFTSDLFGDVNKITNMVKFNWVSLFQLILMVLMLLVCQEAVTWLLEKWAPTAKRAKTMKYLLDSSLHYLLTIVGVFWGLSLIGVDVSTIFASLGIVALIIGFGAERLIADMVTGLFIIFENQYNVGDVIEVDGVRGTVVSIAIRTTSLDVYGNIKVINNSDMRNIINQSSKNSRAICDMPIPYEADIEKAEEELDKMFDELVKEYPDVFIERPSYSGVQQLADSAVILRITAQVVEDNRFKAARIMNRKFKIGLEKAGMGCPFTQIVVHKAE